MLFSPDGTLGHDFTIFIDHDKNVVSNKSRLVVDIFTRIKEAASMIVGKATILIDARALDFKEGILLSFSPNPNPNPIIFHI